MSEPILMSTVLALLEGDEALLEQLREAGFIPRAERALEPEHLETARVVQTLVRELEVNWPGVEIIVRMRRELIAYRRQLTEVVQLMERRREHPR